MLGSVGSAYFHVELVAAVAAGDVNGTSDKGTKRFEHMLTQLLQRGDVLRRDCVVDVILFCCCGFFKFRMYKTESKAAIL